MENNLFPFCLSACNNIIIRENNRVKKNLFPEQKITYYLRNAKKRQRDQIFKEPPTPFVLTPHSQISFLIWPVNQGSFTFFFSFHFLTCTPLSHSLTLPPVSLLNTSITNFSGKITKKFHRIKVRFTHLYYLRQKFPIFLLGLYALLKTSFI